MIYIGIGIYVAVFTWIAIQDSSDVDLFEPVYKEGESE